MNAEEIAIARGVIAAHAAASDTVTDRGPRIEVTTDLVPDRKLVVNALYVATSFHPVYGWEAALCEVARLQIELDRARLDLQRERRAVDLLAPSVPRGR